MFHTESGKAYRMHHEQDCCENVSIDDLCGEVEDLIGSPVLQADESSARFTREDHESCTHTFYRIATAKGQVVIRWLGTSNGYYSESVDFEEILP